MGHYYDEMCSDDWERQLTHKKNQAEALSEALNSVQISVGFPEETEHLIEQLEEKIELIELRYRNNELLKELNNARKD